MDPTKRNGDEDVPKRMKYPVDGGHKNWYEKAGNCETKNLQGSPDLAELARVRHQQKAMALGQEQ